MKTLSLMKRRGISYSSAQNGVEKSIGGEAQPHAPEAFEVDHYSFGAGHDFNFVRGNEHKIESKSIYLKYIY
jgi:hypothetical protein